MSCVNEIEVAVNLFGLKPCAIDSSECVDSSRYQTFCVTPSELEEPALKSSSALRADGRQRVKNWILKSVRFGHRFEHLPFNSAQIIETRKRGAKMEIPKVNEKKSFTFPENSYTQFLKRFLVVNILDYEELL